MNFKKLLRPFRRKMILEGFIKSALYSLTISSALIFLASFVYHILIKRAPLDIILISGAGVFVLSFLLIFFIKYFPSNKKVARRMDKMGLYDRVATMLELENDESEIARLQREDAIAAIKKANTKQMKFSSLKKKAIACLLCLCLGAGMMALPYDAFSMRNIISEENEEFIRNLISGLRQQIKDAFLPPEIEKEVEKIIDELEEELKDAKTELEQLGKIEEAKEKIEELIDELAGYNFMGEALKLYELTYDLGVAMCEKSEEKVKTELQNLENKLLTDKSLVFELGEVLYNALIDSGLSPKNMMYMAYLEFSVGLTETDTDAPDYELQLAKVFDKAEKDIIDAMKGKKALDDMAQSLGDAKNQALGKENEKQEQSQNQNEGQNQQEQKPNENQQNEQNKNEQDTSSQPPSGAGTGDSGEDKGEDIMTEIIYDAELGYTTYGEVFSYYYGKYLEAVKNGNVTRELQEIVDRYYTALS